jgi:RHS repeat-associated protein
LVSVGAGGALLAGGLSACLPNEDEGWGWNIQQVVVESGYEPRVGGPVSVASDGAAIGYTGPEPVAVPGEPTRVPELFVADQAPRGVVVREMAVPGEYPEVDYRTWDGVLSADGLVMVGVGDSAQVEARAEPDPGQDGEPGDEAGEDDEVEGTGEPTPEAGQETSDGEPIPAPTATSTVAAPDTTADADGAETAGVAGAGSEDDSPADVTVPDGGQASPEGDVSGGEAPSDPGEPSALFEPDCGNEHWHYDPQVLRWSRPSRSSEFGPPELVSMDVAATQACIASGVDLMEGWMGVRGALGPSGSPSLSADGSTVVFVSLAPNLGADQDAPTLIYRDGQGAVGRVTAPAWTDAVREAQVSGNGLHIAFVAQADDADAQVYVVSRASVGAGWGAPAMVSTVVGGGPSDTVDGNRNVTISFDGGRVAWTSDELDFEAGVTAWEAGARVLVVWDRSLGLTHIARSRGDYSSAYPLENEGHPELSVDGKRLAITSEPLTTGPPVRLVLFDVDKVMSGVVLSRMRSVAASRPFDPDGIVGGDVGLAGGAGAYAAVLAADGPVERYWDDPPALYLVGGIGFGAGISRAWHGDPVDVAAGAFAHSDTDVVGRGNLRVERSYNSLVEEHRTLFGQGWSTVYDARLDIDELEASVRVFTPEGRSLVYWETDTAGQYTTGAGSGAVLSGHPNGFRWVERSGRTLVFDLAGGLVGTEQPGRPDVTVTRTATEVFVEFDETATAWLRFIDDAGGPGGTGGDGRADRLESSDGVQVVYDTSGRGLSWASRPHVPGESDVLGRRYEWDGRGRIEKVVDEVDTGRERLVVDNTYDGLGRVVEQVNATGDVVEFHHGMRHDATGWVRDVTYTTTVNQASGDMVQYHYGPGGDLVGVTDPSGATRASAWQADQNSSVTSRSGVVTATTFDAANRPVAVTETAAGATITIASYSYVVADTAAGAGVDRRLASSTDAAGVTTWFTYDPAANSMVLPATVSVPCDPVSLKPGLSCPGSGRSTTTYLYGTGTNEGLVVSVTDADGVVTEYAYHDDRTLASTTTFPDATTELVSTTDVMRRGDTGFAEADPAAAWVQVDTAADGAVTETVYGADGRVLAVRDPLFDGTIHLATLYTYWGDGTLRSVTDPAGATTTHEVLRPGDSGFSALAGVGVDPAEIEVVTDADGVSTVTVTDRSGDVVAVATGDVADPGGLAVTTHAYGPLARLTSTTDPEGVVTRYGYDTEGRLTQTTVGAELGTPERTTTNTWNARGRLVAVSGPVSADPDTNSVQAVESFTYDSAGRQRSRIEGNPTDPSSRVMTTSHYDAAGRQWRTVEHRAGNLDPGSSAPAAGDAVVETRFTLAGRTGAVVAAPPDEPGFNWATAPDTAKSWTTYGYDGAGRQITVTGPDDTTWSTSFDEAGRVATRVSPEGRTTTYGFDDAGRQITVTTPSPTGTGMVTAVTAYTPAGLVESETDPHVPVPGTPDPSTRSFTYTPGGRLDTATDAVGNSVTYTYDVRGNRATRTALDDADDPVVEEWSWDLADRLIAHTAPPPGPTADPALTTNTYDPDTGWLTSTADATGRTATYDRYGDGSVRSTTYTAASMPTYVERFWRNSRSWVTKATASDPAGTLTTVTGFNRAGETTSVTTPAGPVLSYGWDLAGNVVAATTGFGVFTFAHDPAGRTIASTVDAGGGPATLGAYSYDDDGLLVGEVLNNGAQRTWVLNDAGRPVAYTQTTRRPDNSLDTWQAELGWRPDGRLATQTINTDPTVAYGYDDAGQLTTATDTPDGDWAWTYGTRGNPATTTYDAAVTTWTTNPNGSVATATTAGVTTSYGYDAAGRRTTATTGTAVTTTDYDTAGRLAAIVTGDTIRARRYDAQGLIASITTATPGATTVTAQISDTTMEAVSRTIATNDGNGWTHQLWGPAGPILAIGAGAYGTYQTDDLGSVIEDPTNPQIINGPTHYTPTGEAASPIADNQLGYRAEQTTAGLTHLRNRDHDPTTTQFLTPDPLDGIDGTPTVGNSYHYADNDPLSQTDPLGLRACDQSVRCSLPEEDFAGYHPVPCEWVADENRAYMTPTAGDLWDAADIALGRIEFFDCGYIPIPETLSDRVSTMTGPLLQVDRALGIVSGHVVGSPPSDMPQVFTSSIYYVDDRSGVPRFSHSQGDPLVIKSPLPMVSAIAGGIELLTNIEISIGIEAASVAERDYAQRLSSVSHPTVLRSELGDWDVLLVIRRPESFRCRQRTDVKIIGLPFPRGIDESGWDPCG